MRWCVSVAAVLVAGAIVGGDVAGVVFYDCYFQCWSLCPNAWTSVLNLECYALADALASAINVECIALTSCGLPHLCIKELPWSTAVPNLTRRGGRPF